MAYSPGILPTPRSPIIKDGVPASYIKQSYYPIPYPAIIAIENSNIHEVISWDINVNHKSIKIKVDWALAKDKMETKSIFPKSVYDSISSYNINQPTWSSSCSRDKLSLKVEWKISNPNPSNTSKISTPSLKPSPIPGHLFTTPKHNTMNDSGYGSPIFSSPHRVNVSTPAGRLFFPSPNHKTNRHDVYRNSPNSKTSVPTHNTSSSSNTLNPLLLTPIPNLDSSDTLPKPSITLPHNDTPLSSVVQSNPDGAVPKSTPLSSSNPHSPLPSSLTEIPLVLPAPISHQIPNPTEPNPIITHDINLSAPISHQIPNPTEPNPIITHDPNPTTLDPDPKPNPPSDQKLPDTLPVNHVSSSSRSSLNPKKNKKKNRKKVKSQTQSPTQAQPITQSQTLTPPRFSPLFNNTFSSNFCHQKLL